GDGRRGVARWVTCRWITVDQPGSRKRDRRSPATAARLREVPEQGKAGVSEGEACGRGGVVVALRDCEGQEERHALRGEKPREATGHPEDHACPAPGSRPVREQGRKGG